jgi:hypothetical protein
MFEPPSDWTDGLPPADDWLDRYGLAEAAGADPAVRLSLGWTVALTEQPEVIEQIEAVMAAVPFARRAAIGLLSPELDHEITRPPYFGVIIYADAADGFEFSEPLQQTISANGTNFAAVVRRGAFVPHRGTLPKMQPGQGRVAYWGHSRRGQCKGWVTAEHVADNLAYQHGGQVVDRAQPCLDAALVDLPQSGGGAPIAAYQAICATLDVELDLPTPITAQVIDVEAGLHLMKWSSRFPLRFSVNAHGKLGDSGSRIVETKTGRNTPLGIYLGAFEPVKPTTAAGGKAGYALALSQLEKLITLEIYI